ncbi:hypothetical protein CcaverHIS002_0202490 [Cutaneotrichosporon cavernicola]|uniref:DUF803-domain-containing protein n=1 Tax=Cutaneotrichosporon cavernicola TaxID=279322 RepID=A0AA48I3E6_9TREE|nr:uncharacterized protein CcaverHIS019_0202510 [Cutaneotrichosporon cavernicola]BEI81089.1 hypothetical protein CcaverHIS002_0202490 [Cutaneotrichosporon cavernicola]BEI88889.1 hypothetical protein CcaverHIS019_0202510 [Cutaneotrichosporon cavernicola]BEI96666.1 hypothetical protein CcaverHIS631_0202550 [Cutaneotrichosporon cavernicola]BEJ04437.1 hypothetical protein CcaverHIS641_0202540 [Cutaneotrichosporon cavernicola]
MGDTASLIGVAIACAGNVLISLALTIQKLAHSRQERDALSSLVTTAHPVGIEPERRPSGASTRSFSPTYGADGDWATLGANARLGDSPVAVQVELADGVHGLDGAQSPPAVNEGDYLRSKLWWLGLALMSVGECGNFLSYGFAPASVVAPLGTVALIANCVFAPLVLHERFTKRNVLGVALAILGAITVVWSGKGSNPRLSPDELIAAIIAPPMIALMAVTAVLIGIGVWLSNEPFGAQHIVVDVGTCALFGGYTVMATKALSSLMSTSPLTALREPVAWGAIVILIVTSVFQIKFLNRALMRFESKEVIPTQFVFFSMSAIVGSAVLYEEFRDMTLSTVVNFAFGIATTFLGVYFLTTPPGEVSEPEELLVVPQPRLPLSPVAEETPLLRRSNSSRRTSLAPTGRLIKRGSQSNIALGVTQGGLLLLASTPPVSPSTSLGHRAPSRSSFTTDGANGQSQGNWQAFENVLPGVSSRR